MNAAQPDNSQPSRSLPSHTSGGGPPRVGAIVVAAGDSRRMRGVDKIFHSLGGKPIICRSLAALNAHPLVGEIALVVSERGAARALALVGAHSFSKVRSVCPGGARRQDSVRAGLDALGGCELVAVHDGARPFIDAAVVDRAIAAAAETGAATAATPVKDTIKAACPGGFIARTIPRAGLWAAQTPQIFRRELLEAAHSRAAADSADEAPDATDDASMVEAMGVPVKLFMGSYYNIKITTPEDLALAEAILRLRALDADGRTADEWLADAPLGADEKIGADGLPE